MKFSAGWGYLLTGMCWGIGVASGTYLGDKVGDPSADFSKSIRQRCVGAGVGTFGMLLAFAFIIGPALGPVLPAGLAEAHSQAMPRAWGEVCEQSVSVWAFLWFFARHLHKVYWGSQP